MLLELSNISKHFGAIQAVNDISLSLEAGQVVGLMGDNGAGKSTLVKMIAGNFRPSHGTMRLNGNDIVLHRPIEARQFGIEIVHQDLALCDNLSAAANVFLGRELRRGIGPLRVLDYKAMYRRAGEIFKELRSETRPRDLVRQMSGGQRQAVAIARTMISQAKIVLMDEPFGALDPLTRDALGEDYRALHRSLGLTTVMITHDMAEALLLADRIAVMRAGRLVAQGAAQDLAKSTDAYVNELLNTPRRQAERLQDLLPKDGV